LTTSTKKPNLSFILQHPAHFFGMGFGSGLAKKAPGTAGTLVALPLAWVLAIFSTPIQLLLITLLFLIGIPICSITGKALGVVDHGGIVWDEIVAMLLVLSFTPNEWQWWLTAFLLFRLFDIWKPYPIRQLDANLKNGFGVMFDDLLAAIYAIICLELMLWMTTYF
jgi:phosphatidylglycerophosphatase A